VTSRNVDQRRGITGARPGASGRASSLVADGIVGQLALRFGRGAGAAARLGGTEGVRRTQTVHAANQRALNTDKRATRRYLRLCRSNAGKLVARYLLSRDALRLPRTAAETILPVRLSGATMSDPSTTTLSSKGQVVIPEEIRERLGLKAGAQFVVLGDKDVVIFKILQPPAKRDFTALVQQARQAAKQTGMRRADIATAVSKTRRARRAK